MGVHVENIEIPAMHASSVLLLLQAGDDTVLALNGARASKETFSKEEKSTLLLQI